MTERLPNGDGERPARGPHAGLGRPLRRSTAGAVAAAVAAVAIVGGDLLLALHDRQSAGQRLLLTLAALALYGWLSGWEWASLGLRVRPVQGWGYWAKFTAKLGAVIVFLFLVPSIYFARTGVLPIKRIVAPPFLSASEFWAWACTAWFVAPFVEEGIYRLTLCPPSAALLGPRLTVVLSGCAFAALHVAYGNPGPDNVLAGFILGWAFLKSECLLVPIGLHFLGNVLVGLYLLAFWSATA